MAEKVHNALFLCTGNSCRSIMAETLLNHLGQGRFQAFSAGSRPAGSVNPEALAALERRGIAARNPRSKTWDEFAEPGAPVMDFVITVCDDARGEPCPVWPGGPMAAHWGMPDPAVFRGSAPETAAFFDKVLGMLERRIAALVALPVQSMDDAELKSRLKKIGEPNAKPVFSLSRQLAAEGLGTALLLATVVGSGIMGERLSGGIQGLALMANSIATGAVLVVLILILSPVSGAHINPAVTLSFALRKDMTWSHAGSFWAVQFAGGLAGVFLAHFMFSEPLLQVSATSRGGFGQWAAEVVATFGLVASILGCLRWRPEAIPYAVGLYITAAYWFTASTSFANPAVTIARGFTDTFSGIAPMDAPGFIAAQIAGAVLATVFLAWLYTPKHESSP